MLYCKVKVVDQIQKAVERQLGRKSPEGKKANGRRCASVGLEAARKKLSSARSKRVCVCGSRVKMRASGGLITF